MSPENAIDWLKIIKVTLDFNNDKNKIIALDMAIDAMQKQIPAPPIKEDWNPSLCPNCKAELSDFVGDGYYKDRLTQKMCGCGQKLNWG